VEWDCGHSLWALDDGPTGPGALAVECALLRIDDYDPAADESTTEQPKETADAE